MSGVVPAGPEKALLVAFVATSLLFAGRKYTQAIKDDIGDKSVFMCVPAMYRVLRRHVCSRCSATQEVLQYHSLPHCQC